jgi:hypothetical protein
MIDLRMINSQFSYLLHTHPLCTLYNSLYLCDLHNLRIFKPFYVSSVIITKSLQDPEIVELCTFQIFFSVLDLCCKCIDLHPRGEAVRRSFVNNVLEDIANTENMDFWMKEGLEELEEVRTEKSNLVTISKRIAEE